MAEALGKMLELLEISGVWNLYVTSVMRVQPADLVRRLDTENMSTRGHMPELRGRLLRLEVARTLPGVEVPWYPEDFEATEEKPTRRDDDLLDKFFRVARYQEAEVKKTRASKAKRREGDEGDKFHAVLEKLDGAVREYLTRCEDELRMDSSPVDENADEIIDESEYIFEDPEDDPEGTREKTSTISDESDDSIVKIGSDQESFEKLDAESVGSWERDSWCSGSASSVCCPRRMAEVD